MPFWTVPQTQIVNSAENRTRYDALERLARRFRARAGRRSRMAWRCSSGTPELPRERRVFVPRHSHIAVVDGVHPRAHHVRYCAPRAGHGPRRRCTRACSTTRH